MTSQFNGRLECHTHNRLADRHDHDATPKPARPVTVLDQIRARLRWQYLHDHPGDDDAHDDETDEADGLNDTYHDTG